MNNRTIRVTTNERDRIKRRITNSILANASRVDGDGLFGPTKPGNKAERVADLVFQDLIADFRFVRRKP